MAAPFRSKRLDAKLLTAAGLPKRYRFQTCLPAELLLRIKDAAAAQEIPMSEYVWGVLEAYVPTSKEQA